MRTNNIRVFLATLLSIFLAVPVPVLARGFGGSGGGGHFGGGRMSGGGRFGGDGSLGRSGGGFGGRGRDSFSGGFGAAGGRGGMGGDRGFAGAGGMGSGQGFAGNKGLGTGSGFGGDKGFGSGQGFAGNKGFGNGSGFGGDKGFGNGGTGFGGDKGFGNGAGFAGNGGFGNRPGFDGFGGEHGFGNGGFQNNHPNFGEGGFQNNHPNFGNGGHFPTDGGFGGISGNLNHNPHNISSSTLDNQGKNMRNSFNGDTVNNFNHYGGYGNHGWANGYAHGYANGFYHGSWNYPGGWSCPGWSEGAAWTFMGVSALTSFLGIGMMAAASHGGGGGGSKNSGNVTNVTYEGDNVYVNGVPSGTAAQYYTQAQQLAGQACPQPYYNNYSSYYANLPPSGQNSPSSAPANPNEQWQPLGVFALAEPGQTESNMLFQLAINKEGIIRGNYMNQLTNEKAQVYGALDKKTQRISFTIGQNNSTVFDTDLATLVKDNSQVLVHYSPTNTQEMAFIRMSQNGQDSGQPNQSPTSSS